MKPPKNSKLKLKELTVKSFATNLDKDEKQTVQGQTAVICDIIEPYVIVSAVVVSVIISATLIGDRCRKSLMHQCPSVDLQTCAQKPCK